MTIPKSVILYLYCFLFLSLFSTCSDRETAPSEPPLDFSFTEISGSLKDTLKYSDSPFLATGEIIVEASNKLIVQAGVVIHFAKEKGVTVYGTLELLGSKSSPILLMEQENNWKGIFITNSASALINFCAIKNVVNFEDTSSRQGGAITVINSSASISNCIFENNRSLNGGAIFIESSDCEITNNIFRGNYGAYFGGTIFSDTSNISVINNSFYKNRCDNYGGGIVIYNNHRSTIQNNIFHQNAQQSGGNGISVPADSGETDINFNFLSTNSNNPFFVSENDLHLLIYSPCKNGGNPNPEFNDSDGTRNDQGAYGGPLGNW